ncbi:hypothetical protein Acr_24g0008520 [Actinidia rufa]|uniref:Reverse transcriptase Ty1/copia-type domain-containing protein n=1 Tax=Actinidia rufa TaxID=165716 RepID=A0A7J0GV53_9ERIC|nr:hypothetical protein Acr_24g0008520 [Actinidia rufa]
MWMGSMLISGKRGMSIGLDLVGDGVKYPNGRASSILRSGKEIDKTIAPKGCFGHLVVTLALFLVGSILVLRVFNYYFATRTLAVKNSLLGANQVFGAVAGESSSTDPTPPALPPVPLPSDIPVRRSTRVREVPSYLRDYHCFSTVLAQYEPRSYREASTNPLWQQAMTEELQALDRTHTWDLVDLPPGKSIIGCRWVYKIKTRADGTVERYKARLVGITKMLFRHNRTPKFLAPLPGTKGTRRALESFWLKSNW